MFDIQSGFWKHLLRHSGTRARTAVRVVRIDLLRSTEFVAYSEFVDGP